MAFMKVSTTQTCMPLPSRNKSEKRIPSRCCNTPSQTAYSHPRLPSCEDQAFIQEGVLVLDLHLRRTDSLPGENLEESLHKRLLSGTVSL